MDDLSKKPQARAYFILFALVMVAVLVEIACRSLNLTDRFSADFKFYIRHVDEDIYAPWNTEDALLMWAPKPNYNDGIIKINSQGFRDQEYSPQKPPNTIRILCLGDSSTFRGEYPSMLEDRLNKNFTRQNLCFEVINAGVTGYTSYQGLCMYKYKGARYSPDIVTFYFGINEPIKRFYLNDKEILQERVPVILKIIKNRLLLKLHSYRLFRKFITGVTKKNDSSRSNVPRVSLGDFRENVIELNSLCKKNGSVLVLISPPLCEEKAQFWERAPDIALYREELKKISDEYDIPYVYIAGMTERSKQPTDQYFLDTVHPNEAGNELIAQRLFEYLVSSGLLDASEERNL